MLAFAAVVVLHTLTRVLFARLRSTSTSTTRFTFTTTSTVLRMGVVLGEMYCGAPVEIRADALASLNGRQAHPLIDPETDLTKEEDSPKPQPWILPAPTEPPPRSQALLAHQ